MDWTGWAGRGVLSVVKWAGAGWGGGWMDGELAGWGRRWERVSVGGDPLRLALISTCTTEYLLLTTGTNYYLYYYLYSLILTAHYVLRTTYYVQRTAYYLLLN